MLKMCHSHFIVENTKRVGNNECSLNMMPASVLKCINTLFVEF